ncbi:MAG: MarR family transcriptional regulator [Deferrisomatales bacterium]|nr:MarR family transcriptional regulator [Deferrisomatales bacterium]
MEGAGGSRSKAEQLTLSSYVKLLRAAESVSARAHRHLNREKLSFSQFGVLEALYHLGPLVQRDLATKLLKSARNITMVVDNLEKRGLVRRVRSETDRRFTHIHMTPEGRLLFEKVFPRHVAGILEEMRVLSPRELEELGEFCRRLGRQPERGDP